MGHGNEFARAPGAMTRAMQAVRDDSARRVLRIGVIQNATIVDERVVRDHVAVSVGTTERAMFAVTGARAPKCHELFRPHGDQYALEFNDTMDGRVALHDRIWSFAELRASGKAERKQNGWSLPLEPTARGRVIVGDTTLLFQFVVPPPIQPKAQLPAAIRIDPLKAIDWAYTACLAFFVTFGFLAVSYVEYAYDPDVDDFAVESRWITPAPPPTITLVNPAGAEPDDGANTNTSRTSAPTHHVAPRTGHATPTPAHNTGPTDHAGDVATRAANAALTALAQSLRWSGLTGQPTAQAGGVVDGLAQGAEMNQTVAAMGNATAITNNDAAFARRGGRADTGGAFHSHALTPGGPAVSTGGDTNLIAAAPRGIVHPETFDPPDDPRGINPSEVAHVVQQSLGGIRWCYNQGLQHFPTLAGRIEVRFTIGGTGRILGAADIDGFDAAPEVKECIRLRFRSMMFPSPEHPVQFSFPFQFTPGT